MKRLDDRLKLAKIVLEELKSQPLCRTELETHILRQTGTHSSFESIFCYLSKGGFVQKSEQKSRANYVLTEKGTKLLEAIQ
jgi:predicted transcriptional regulator